LSAAEIAKGVGIASRLFREDCTAPACKRTNKVKAAAELQAFRAKHRKRTKRTARTVASAEM
jgi:hypothetical protein